MTERPTYVGIGECACARIDVQLYHLPRAVVTQHPVCARCLVALGFEVPVPRTADDLALVGGVPVWKPQTSPMRDIGVEPLVHVGRLDLGHGHIFEVVYGVDDCLVGWLHTHPDQRNPTAELCQSFCAVRPLNGSPIHQVISVDPLTLTPSLQCRTCGAHGHVRDNLWEPC
jgi:hypothetical protein